MLPLLEGMPFHILPFLLRITFTLLTHKKSIIPHSYLELYHYWSILQINTAFYCHIFPPPSLSDLEIIGHIHLCIPIYQYNVWHRALKKWWLNSTPYCGVFLRVPWLLRVWASEKPVRDGNEIGCLGLSSTTCHCFHSNLGNVHRILLPIRCQVGVCWGQGLTSSWGGTQTPLFSGGPGKQTRWLHSLWCFFRALHELPLLRSHGT